MTLYKFFFLCLDSRNESELPAEMSVSKPLCRMLHSVSRCFMTAAWVVNIYGLNNTTLHIVKVTKASGLFILESDITFGGKSTT